MVGNLQPEGRTPSVPTQRLRWAMVVCLALTQLGGCALRPERAPTAETPPSGQPPAPPPASAPAPPAEPAIRHAEVAESARTERELLAQLRRDPQLSVASSEAGYFLDVMQARLLQMQATGIRVERETGQFRITLAASMFESGQASLTDAAQARVAAVADVLRVYQATAVVVHGHTDSSGSPQLNLALSRQRAEAVARVLLENGVARARLLVVGHGATRPRAGNETPEGQATNRRVELVLRLVVRDAGEWTQCRDAQATASASRADDHRPAFRIDNVGSERPVTLHPESACTSATDMPRGCARWPA